MLSFSFFHVYFSKVSKNNANVEEKSAPHHLTDTERSFLAKIEEQRMEIEAAKEIIFSIFQKYKTSVGINAKKEQITLEDLNSFLENIPSIFEKYVTLEGNSTVKFLFKTLSTNY